MHRPGGYGLIIDPSRSIEEFDTFTCSHCNSVKLLRGNTKIDDIAKKCLGCMKWICTVCADKQVLDGACVTYERFLDDLEKRIESRRRVDDLLTTVGG